MTQDDHNLEVEGVSTTKKPKMSGLKVQLLSGGFEYATASEWSALLFEMFIWMFLMGAFVWFALQMEGLKLVAVIAAQCLQGIELNLSFTRRGWKRILP